MIRLSCIVNTIVAYDLVAQGTKASVAMVLAWFSRNILVSALAWLKLDIVFSYPQTDDKKRIFVGNEIVYHSVEVGASHVGAAPSTSSFSI